MSLSRAGLLCFLFMALTTGNGCGFGERPLPDLMPCTGTVTLDDVPLASGSILFAPVDEKIGQPAVGHIKNGEFTMLTTVSSPGVVIGKYTILIESTPDDAPLPESGGVMPRRSSSLIPAKYGDITTSGLEVEVREDLKPLHLKLVSQ